ncbi:uncharacterized protein LOC143296428 [Babylonia areolata]|uniref:uncharacterized protein LOC143296428 n=1 Tax=Babylonia areolata TaxID=304850 RepID=UPI003FCF5017
MNPSDYSHLYHDSHFSSVSGVMEAREQMRAREVNAREQRLLRQQDQQLRQAKESCRRRHSWQQDTVRRDLKAILERTPTFDRSLKDEHQKRSTGQSVTARSPNKNGLVTSLPLPVSCGSFPKLTRSQISPIATRRMNTLKTNPQSNSTSHANRRKTTDRTENPRVKISETNTCPGQHAEARQPGEKVPEGLFRVIPTAPVHRHSLPELHTSSLGASAESAQPGLPLQDSPRLGGDVLSRAHRKGAHLRRRSHHTLMAIVRVQTRHRQRRLSHADVTVGTAGRAAPRRHSQLADCSFTSLRPPPTAWSLHPTKTTASPDDFHQSSAPSVPPTKLSWLSVPVALSDVTDAGHSPRDLRATRARPRFYSVD